MYYIFLYLSLIIHPFNCERKTKIHEYIANLKKYTLKNNILQIQGI